MQVFLGIAVLSSALAVIHAQRPGVPGGLYSVEENTPEVQKAKALILQELRDQAKSLPGSPYVEISDFSAQKQVVAGILYKLSFKANYIIPGGKTTKVCTASVIEHLGSNGKLEFLEDYQTKQKILCR